MLKGDQPKKATQRGKETARVDWKLGAEREVGVQIQPEETPARPAPPWQLVPKDP